MNCQPNSQVTIGEVNHREAYFGCYVYTDEATFSYQLLNPLTGEWFYPEVSTPSYTQNYYLLAFSGLMPNSFYELYLISDQREVTDTILSASITTQVDWQYKTTPPDFSFVTGSCNYINELETDRPGKPYGSEHQLLERMANENANFNLWLGDNVYQRPSDYTSPTGIARRYFHDRKNEYLQMLLASRPNYAILDDHDIGPNDMLSSYFYTKQGQEIFSGQWPRALYGLSTFGDLRWLQTYSDVVFIGLDNRSHRTSVNSHSPQILGKEQIDWLIEQIEYYKQASFIFICIGGQVLNTEAVYETYATYPVEREYLIQSIVNSEYKNAIFLTGDRHHSEVSSMNTEGFRLYDFTISPLTSGVSNTAKNENNLNRVSEVIYEHNYAHISIYGKPGERKLKVDYKNAEGKIIQTHFIHNL